MNPDTFLIDLLGIDVNLFYIQKIEKYKESNEIIIFLKYQSNRCKVEGQEYYIYDYAPLRCWQHLDLFEYKCYIECALPRYIDKNNKVKTFEAPFADKSKTYTHKFGQRIIEVLQEVKVQRIVARLLNTTPYMVRSVMENAVNNALENRGFVTDFKNVSLDEKAYKKGHLYTTILIDSDTNCVLNMVEGRKEKSVKVLFFELNEEERQPQIERINIDMWKPYMNAMKEIAPYALQVHDKFHLVQKLSEAIDKTRKSEVKSNQVLVKHKYTVLRNKENRTEAQNEAFTQMQWENLQTAEAWLIREDFKSILEFDHWQDKLYLYDKWIKDSMAKGLKYVTPVLETFQRHYEGIKNAIVTETSSGKHENINGQIQSLLAKARGFRNFDRLKVNVMFYFGGLDLLPLKFY